MKFYNYIFSLIFIIIVLTPGIILAHPPSDVKIEFDNETKTLYVEITHPVNNVKSHYINKIEVYLNDVLRIVQNFSEQKDKKAQLATYLLWEVKEGSKIKVMASCSIHGFKTREMVIEKQKEEG